MAGIISNGSYQLSTVFTQVYSDGITLSGDGSSAQPIGQIYPTYPQIQAVSSSADATASDVLYIVTASE
jgi:hypothetical protein